MRRNIKKTILGVAIAGTIAGSAYWIYHRSALFQHSIERAIEKKISTLFREKWAKKVPFQLDRIRLDGRTLTIDLSMNGIFLHLEGDIDANVSPQLRTLDLVYRPHGRLSTHDSSSFLFKTEGDLRISAQLDPINPDTLRFDLSADFRPFSVRSRNHDDRMIGLGPSHLEIQFANHDFQVLLRVASLELLWDRHYVSLEKIPWTLKARSDNSRSGQLFASVEEPRRNRPWIEISSESQFPGRFHVRTDRIQIAPLLPTASEWLSMPLLEALSDVHGNVSVEASVDLKAADPAKRIRSFQAQVRNFGARLKNASFQLKHGAFDIDQNGLQISRGRLGFRKIVADVTPIRFDFSAGKPMKTTFPISFSNLGLSFGPLESKIDSPRSFHFSTSMKLNETPLKDLFEKLCISRGRDLPATLMANFSAIEIDPEMTDWAGKARLAIFGGYVDVEDITIFDYLTEVPETQFSATWDDIKLDQAAAWSNFGKIDGVLYGHANDVVLEKWFPTRFDFLLSAKPYRKGDIVFSPDAMKNFVALVAEDALDQIPKFAKFFAFGWPSRAFGGYDVDYAGISMFSADGTILLETLDPKEVYQTQQRHFILYGNRFKMPLESRQYPVILDATAVGNFVHRIINTLSAMRENPSHPEARKEPQDDSNALCQPDL